MTKDQTLPFMEVGAGNEAQCIEPKRLRKRVFA